VALGSWRRWNLATRGLHALYHGSKYPKYSRSVPWVRNPWLRYSSHSGGTSRLQSHLQVHHGGNRTLGMKSMAQVLKPTPVAQVDANGRIQAHSGGTSPIILLGLVLCNPTRTPDLNRLGTRPLDYIKEGQVPSRAPDLNQHQAQGAILDPPNRT
jgi:hypothetical protein